MAGSTVCNDESLVNSAAGSNSTDRNSGSSGQRLHELWSAKIHDVFHCRLTRPVDRDDTHDEVRREPDPRPRDIPRESVDRDRCSMIVCASFITMHVSIL